MKYETGLYFVKNNLSLDRLKTVRFHSVCLILGLNIWSFSCTFTSLKCVCSLSLCILTTIQLLAAMVFVFNKPFQIKSNQNHVVKDVLWVVVALRRTGLYRFGPVWTSLLWLSSRECWGRRPELTGSSDEHKPALHGAFMVTHHVHKSFIVHTLFVHYFYIIHFHTLCIHYSCIIQTWFEYSNLVSLLPPCAWSFNFKTIVLFKTSRKGEPL